MPAAGAPVLAGDIPRHYTKGSQSSAQAFGAATFTAVTFNGADAVDTLNIHDPVTNNSRFQIGLQLGWWLVIGTVAWAGGSANGKRSRLLVSGVSIDGGYDATPDITATTGGFSTTTSIGLAQAVNLADYVELYALTQLAASTQVSGDLRCSMTCIYQGP